MRSYFRINSREDDPERLLDPDHQRSRSWSDFFRGPCDKCEGSGETLHECESCLANGADPGCPSCHGKVRYRGECPACNGSGEVDESTRDGISVFPTTEGLYRYMLKRGANLEGSVLVELEGEPTGDDDFDADEGALLIRPRRIVGVRELDWECIDRLS